MEGRGEGGPSWEARSRKGHRGERGAPAHLGLWGEPGSHPCVSRVAPSQGEPRHLESWEGERPRVRPACAFRLPALWKPSSNTGLVLSRQEVHTQCCVLTFPDPHKLQFKGQRCGVLCGRAYEKYTKRQNPCWEWWTESNLKTQPSLPSGDPLVLNLQREGARGFLLVLLQCLYSCRVLSALVLKNEEEPAKAGPRKEEMGVC